MLVIVSNSRLIVNKTIVNKHMQLIFLNTNQYMHIQNSILCEYIAFSKSSVSSRLADRPFPVKEIIVLWARGPRTIDSGTLEYM